MAPASKVARCVLSGYESVPAGPAIAALVARNGCTASGFAANSLELAQPLYLLVTLLQCYMLHQIFKTF